MGIKGLTALLSEHAPKSMKEHEIRTLFGRKVAIDASMSIYQFLIAVRQKDGTMLMNENGDVTSHLMGFFFRTLRMVDHGIKPAYVFDGKPPELKGGVLAKRFAARNAAKEAEGEAKETGTVEDIAKLSSRQVRPTRQHNEECRRLLTLMGIPVVVAPGEAEAQCAELARGGKVYAAGSEDMDTLTFASPLLLRHLTFSEAKKAPISEINLKVALEELEMTMDQFIELCILLGCDYLEPAKGVGPKTALKLMREHGSLAAVVDFIRGKMEEKQAALDIEAGVEAESDDEIQVIENGSAKKPKKKAVKKEKAKKKVVESEEEDLEVESEDGYEAPDFGRDSGDEDGSAAGPSKSASGSPEKKAASSSSAGKKKRTVMDSDDSDDEVKAVEAPKEEGEDEEEEKPKPKPRKKAVGGMQLPEYWPWEQAKEIFRKPDVLPADEVELEWKKCDTEGLVQFLVREKGFNEDRVRSGAARLDKMLAAKQQGRLDGFFKKLPPKEGEGGAKAKGGKDDKKGGAKRKGDDKEKAGAKKAKGKK